MALIIEKLACSGEIVCGCADITLMQVLHVLVEENFDPPTIGLKESPGGREDAARAEAAVLSPCTRTTQSLKRVACFYGQTRKTKNPGGQSLKRTNA